VKILLKLKAKLLSMLLTIRYRGNMKKISVIIFIYFLFIAGVSAKTFSTTNNYGWVSEAFKYSYQLKDTEGNWTTVVENKKYYIIKEGRQLGNSEQTFSGSLPESGTYVSGRMLVKSWIVKAWVINDGKIWYTKNVVDNSFEYQNFATDNESKYGEWTLDFENSEEFKATGGMFYVQNFHTPLVIGDEDVIFTGLNISDYDDGISLTTGADKWAHGIYFEKERLFKGLIRGIPKKIIRINYSATMTDRENMTGDVVMVLDENGKYLDGNFYRGHQGDIPRTLTYAYRTSDVEFNNLASDGLSGDFKMTFIAKKNTYRIIEGSFDCDTGSASLVKIQSLDDDLNVTSILNAGETSSDGKILQGSGWTLSGSGSTTCQDLTGS